MWADVAPGLNYWKELKPFQKINHFPGMYQIAKKNHLARNLNKMQKMFNPDF
jgi:tubulin polyglutamylase TTLL6/13